MSMDPHEGYKHTEGDVCRQMYNNGRVCMLTGQAALVSESSPRNMRSHFGHLREIYGAFLW